MVTDLEDYAMTILANALPILNDAQRYSTWDREAGEVLRAIDRWMVQFHAKLKEPAQ